MAQCAHFIFGHCASNRARGLHSDAGTTADCGFHARADIDRFQRQIGKPLIRKAHGLQATKRLGTIGQAIRLDVILRRNDFFQPFKEPRIELRNA